MEEEEKETIIISKDKLYRLIKEYREARQSALDSYADNDLVFAYECKAKKSILDSILKSDGIDKAMNTIRAKKKKLRLKQALIRQGKLDAEEYDEYEEM